jgi:hypothetical protein
MRRRGAYTEKVMGLLREWNELAAMKTADPRARTVHGVAYAGFMAMAGLLQAASKKSQPLLAASATEDFKGYLLQHCLEQIHEVDRQVNVNQFWTDVLAALEADAFGRTTLDHRRLFKVAEMKEGEAERLGFKLPEYQMEAIKLQPSKNWKHLILYFQPEAVINAVREYKRRSGLEVYMDRSDLRAQMKTRQYWWQPKGDEHRQRFEGIKGSKSCWAILLSFHELGYNEPGSEAWQEALHPDGDLGVGVASTDWVDPRRGDLFALVDMLTVKGEEN